MEKNNQDDISWRMEKFRLQHAAYSKTVIESSVVDKIVVTNDTILVPEKEFYRFILHYGASIDFMIEHAMRKINARIDFRIKEATQ